MRKSAIKTLVEHLVEEELRGESVLALLIEETSERFEQRMVEMEFQKLELKVWIFKK